VIGFCFADKPVVGYDPTMQTDDQDRVTSIWCEGKWFTVIRATFETQDLVGRATRVWEVEYERKKYILKDAWVKSSCSTSEFSVLAALQGMEGVPQLFCGCDVSINGILLTTGLIRHGLCGDETRSRVRRRVVSSTIGDHVASFSLKRELISAFRDIAVSM
jgi:Fungal protein kinase